MCINSIYINLPKKTDTPIYTYKDRKNKSIEKKT